MGDFTSDPLTEALTENRILHRELKATRELLKGTREEIEQWKTWGVVEIAVRNPSVSEYMSHWEGRATKAEEALSRKEYYDSMRSREIDMAQIPESQKRFVSALLNQRDDSYRKMEESKQENDKLRGILAKSDLDCVYCGLPKKDMGRCYFGFPGCGRADDLMLEANDGRKPEPSL